MPETGNRRTGRAFDPLLAAVEHDLFDGGLPVTAPFMVTVTDLRNADPFMFMVPASTSDADAAVIVGLTENMEMTAHGTYGTSAIAAAKAMRMALAYPDLVGMFILPLHPPTTPEIISAMWSTAPLDAATRGWAEEIPSPQAIALLIDRAAHRCIADGPFDDDTAALGWTPPIPICGPMQHLVVGLFPHSGPPPHAPDTYL